MSKTIFMIHGMWGGPWAMETFKAYFEQRGYRCVATTLRHHDRPPGQPPHPELGTLSLLDYVSDLEREIDALGERPIVLGHSMGGLLAQMVAARGRARAAILVAPAFPRGIFGTTPSVARSFLSVTSKWGFWKKPHIATFGEVRYSSLNRMPPATQRAIYDRFVPESGRVVFEIGYWYLDRRKASAVDLERVTCPVLTLVGEDDRITPAMIVRFVAKRYRRNGTFLRYPGHGHWIMAEPGWESVAADVETWIRTHD